jgi:histone-lysine N-methyltransferase SETMAR
MAKSSEHLSALTKMKRTNFHNFVTGDESWFYLEYNYPSQWSLSRDEVPQNVKPDIGTVNFMLTVIWGINGFHIIDLMPAQCRFNSQYFVEHVMTPLVQKLFPEQRPPHTPRLDVHLDNCRVHFSKVTDEFFNENQIVHVPHPYYSPELVPSDFWLFGRIKIALAGCKLVGPDELLLVISEILDSIPVKELKAVFQGWVKRLRWVIANNGEYYTK